MHFQLPITKGAGRFAVRPRVRAAGCRWHFDMAWGNTAEALFGSGHRARLRCTVTAQLRRGTSPRLRQSRDFVVEGGRGNMAVGPPETSDPSRAGIPNSPPREKSALGKREEEGREVPNQPPEITHQQLDAQLCSRHARQWAGASWWGATIGGDEFGQALGPAPTS